MRPTAVRTDTPTVITIFVSGLDGSQSDTFRFLRYLRNDKNDGANDGGVTLTSDYYSFSIADTGNRRARASELLLPVPVAYKPMYTVWNLTFTTPLSNVTGYHAFALKNVARVQVSLLTLFRVLYVSHSSHLSFHFCLFSRACLPASYELRFIKFNTLAYNM
jgi:hypothetical protein